MTQVTKFLTIFDQNPIITRSLRSRRLSWRLVAALGLAALIYCPACLMALSFILNNWLSSEFLFNQLDELGLIIFYLTSLFLLVMVTLFAPVMSVSAIAGERQTQTLELLVITLLPARSIVLGKLISALVHIFLLIAAVWPLILLSLVTGGVSIIEFFIAGLLLVITGIAFTVIGLFGSSLGKTTTNATIMTYGVILPGFLLGPFLSMLPISILLNFSSRDAWATIEAINFYGWSLAASLNPITAAIYSAILREESGGIFFATSGSGSRYDMVFPWVIFVIFYSLLSWFLIEFMIRRLDQVSQS
jgi:ABC-type transport system involved in multi-copper enzyme maturation permease subunit